MSDEELKWALLTVADPMTQNYADIKTQGLKEPLLEVERFLGLMHTYYYD